MRICAPFHCHQVSALDIEFPTTMGNFLTIYHDQAVTAEFKRLCHKYNATNKTTLGRSDNYAMISV